MNSLVNKKIAVFGVNSAGRNFVNYLNGIGMSVVVLDAKEFECDVKNKTLIDFKSREKIDWSEFECLVLVREELCLAESAKAAGCSVLSIVEFFGKYFSGNNYIALVGDSGASISASLIKYVLCKMKVNMDYDFCIRENYFTPKEFGKTRDYVLEVDANLLKVLQAPHFNSIVLFDLECDVKKIKNMFLEQTEDDIAILNVDNKKVKEFYNSAIIDENYKSKIIPISAKKILKNGYSFVNNEIYVNVDGKNDEYMTNEFKNLNGDQNKINILATITLLANRGLAMQEIIENLYNFKGADDIFEKVLHKENFTFVNDIKNKNKSQSLVTFDNIYWILCLDKIDFEFEEFTALEKYFDKLRYVFLLGTYNDDLLKIFKENDVNYFVMYDMKSIFDKMKELMGREKKEEKYTILLSSINDIGDDEFYAQCSRDFEKLLEPEDE